MGKELKDKKKKVSRTKSIFRTKTDKVKIKEVKLSKKRSENPRGMIGIIDVNRQFSDNDEMYLHSFANMEKKEAANKKETADKKETPMVKTKQTKKVKKEVVLTEAAKRKKRKINWKIIWSLSVTIFPVSIALMVVFFSIVYL